MTNTRTADAGATLAQIERLAAAGCEIVRVTVNDSAAADALPEIVAASPLPVVADIHFDHRLALSSLKAGVHGLRINPGNIGDREKVREVAAAVCEHRVPIRIGVNAGSLEKRLRERVEQADSDAHDTELAAALVESALTQARLLEDEGVAAIKVSLKASSVRATVLAYRSMAAQSDYPLHLGVTEAGTLLTGSIKSALGIGILLAEGIGDTLRVSLSAPPEEEVLVARRLLQFLGIRRSLPEVISCPTCGRSEIAVAKLAEEVERRLSSCLQPLTVAVMGCVVNGPGEAAAADFGICGSKGKGVLFRKGKVLRTVAEDELLDVLFTEIQSL